MTAHPPAAGTARTRPYRPARGSLTNQLAHAVAHGSAEARLHLRQLAITAGEDGTPVVPHEVVATLRAGFPDATDVLKKISFVQLCFKHGQLEALKEVLEARPQTTAPGEIVQGDDGWLKTLCCFERGRTRPILLFKAFVHAVTTPIHPWSADFLALQLSVNPKDAALLEQEAKQPQVAALIQQARMSLAIAGHPASAAAREPLALRSRRMSV